MRRGIDRERMSRCRNLRRMAMTRARLEMLQTWKHGRSTPRAAAAALWNRGEHRASPMVTWWCGELQSTAATHKPHRPARRL